MNHRKQFTDRLLFFGLTGLQVAIVLWFWWHGSYDRFSSEVDIVSSLGRLAGLLLAQAVLLQFVFMSRLPVMERALGTELRYKLHRWNGYAIFYLLSIHFLSLELAYASVNQLSLIGQFFDFINNYEDVFNGIIAGALLLVIIGLSIKISRSKLKYEWWYFVHLLVYGAILLAWGHQLHIGTDFLGQPLFVAYWYLLYGSVAMLVLVFRFLRPMYISYRYRLTVSRVVKEASDTISIYISAQGLPASFYTAGQYGIFRFLTPQLWWQAHPFSFSTAPHAGLLRITVKASGDYTRNLVDVLKPGAPVFLDGPHGVFTYEPETRKPAFIAGGAGITPLRSMIEALPAEIAAQTTLLYAIRSQEFEALLPELNEISASTGLRVIPIYSQTGPPKAEIGFLDSERIRRLLPDVADRAIYLCGPPPMMTAVRKELSTLGVPKAQIHSELFEF